MNCTIVDVFAESPLSGNQLAVVHGAGHLDAATMQAIALETNFSELMKKMSWRIRTQSSGTSW